jgi:hypothetical protein
MALGNPPPPPPLITSPIMLWPTTQKLRENPFFQWAICVAWLCPCRAIYVIWKVRWASRGLVGKNMMNLGRRVSEQSNLCVDYCGHACQHHSPMSSYHSKRCFELLNEQSHGNKGVSPHIILPSYRGHVQILGGNYSSASQPESILLHTHIHVRGRLAVASLVTYYMTRHSSPGTVLGQQYFLTSWRMLSNYSSQQIVGRPKVQLYELL